MKTSPSDAAAALLEELAAGGAPSPEDVARETEARRLGPLVRGDLELARAAEALACDSGRAEVAGVERELREAQALLERLGPRRTAAYRAADAIASQHRRKVEHLERVLQSRGKLLPEFRELSALGSELEARYLAAGRLLVGHPDRIELERDLDGRALVIRDGLAAAMLEGSLTADALGKLHKLLDAKMPPSPARPPAPAADEPEEFLDARFQRSFR